jgi:hypothetical protein
MSAKSATLVNSELHIAMAFWHSSSNSTNDVLRDKYWNQLGNRRVEDCPHAKILHGKSDHDRC